MSLFDPNKYRAIPFMDEWGGWDQPANAVEVVITHDDLVCWLTRTVSQNRELQRPNRSQKLMDDLAAVCLAENEIALGIAVVILHSLRVAGQTDRALQLLLQLGVDLKLDGSMKQNCRVCGCTDAQACPGGNPACGVGLLLGRIRPVLRLRRKVTAPPSSLPTV